MGRETPTVIITNGRDINTVPDRAVRPADDHRTTPRRDLQAFCTDALSSTINLDVDLDIVLCVLAQALLAAFRARLGPGLHHRTPGTLQRRFLDTPGTILNDADTITFILNRRAYSPVLRQSDLPADTIVPWWQGRQLRFQFA
jgi:hypothetical protein